MRNKQHSLLETGFESREREEGKFKKKNWTGNE